MARRKVETVDAGSGDVLVDLGFADAEERKLRVQLAMQVNELTAARRLTQARVAELLGIPQPHVSELKNPGTALPVGSATGSPAAAPAAG